MAYYLEVLRNTSRKVTLSIPSPTVDGAGDFDYFYEFEVYGTGSDFPVASSGDSSASSQLIFLKSSALELRGFNSSTLTLSHGVTYGDFNVYKVRPYKVGASRSVDFYVNGALVSTTTVSSGSGFTIGDLFPYGTTSRGGGLKYFKFEDTVTPANNKAYGPFDTTPTSPDFPPDGTLIGFPTDDSQWVYYDAGGGLTVTESAVTLDINTQNPLIDLTGSIEVVESTSTLNIASQAPAIALTATITIEESTRPINLTGLNPSIILTPPDTIVIEESSQSISLVSQDPIILFSGTITVEETTQTIDWLARKPIVTIGLPEYTQIFVGVEKAATFAGGLKLNSFAGTIPQAQIFIGTEKNATFLGVIQ